uniref:Molybdenum cofactor biosynthesis protein MoaA n=1 Tax=Ignisphaera aggregans TaxID=334771 RepID=A0A7C5Z6G6_9CREN
MVYDPILLSNDIEKYVIYMKDSKILRKYYKFRATKFYGGSATGDVVGCNLRCKFCWSWHLNTPFSFKKYRFLYRF